MKSISIAEASTWLARMAGADGVISPTERKVLTEFAKEYDLNAGKLIRRAYAFAKNIDLPEVDLIGRSEMKGKLFEQFVVSLLDSNCRLLAWRSDKIAGNTYAAENLYPDLHVHQKLESAEVEYFIECKYRSSWGENGVDLSEQFNRYHFHAKERGIELFIALGIGGNPAAPEELFFIPGRMVKLDKKIDRDRFIKCLCGKSQEEFHRYISHYYDRRVFRIK